MKGDIEVLEKIQRKATRIPTELRELDYEVRLQRWGLTTLEKRRARGDLIQIYKVRNELQSITWHTNSGPRYAPPSNSRQGTMNVHRMREETFSSKLRNDHGNFVTVRERFFLNRTVENWNKLVNSQIEAQSLNSFKANIDR